MKPIFATLELTKDEVEALYFILRRVGGIGRTRSAADNVKCAIEGMHDFEPKDARAGNPLPAPIDIANPCRTLFVYEKSPEHLRATLQGACKSLPNNQP